MLKFERLSFKSGTIVVKEVWDNDGVSQTTTYTFKPRDNGKIASYHNEPYLLQKYPVLFTAVPQ